MKRLTKRWGEQPYPNLAGKVVCEYRECDSAKSCNDCVHGRIAQRLAAIEDILGEEYDLERLRELVESEKEDRRIPPGYALVKIEFLEELEQQAALRREQE